MTEMTQKLVRSLFDYRDGELYWKVKSAYNITIGSRAGSSNGRYYHIGINGKLHYNHRLIYLYHHNYLPKYLDHVDGNPLNNKIENLREATNSQNQMNAIKQKNSSSIYKGVSWHKIRNKWRSRIRIDDKQKHLGSFESETDAAIAYNNAAIELFGDHANLNVVVRCE